MSTSTGEASSRGGDRHRGRPGRAGTSQRRWFPAVLSVLILLLVGCGSGSGGIVEVGQAADQVDVPSEPVSISSETRSCWDDEPEVGCPQRLAPAGTQVQITPEVLVTYVDSDVSVEPNLDYGSPLIIRFAATFEIRNDAATPISIYEFVMDHVEFEVEGRSRDLRWETADGDSSERTGYDSALIEPGTTRQVTARFAAATRGWDVAEGWDLDLLASTVNRVRLLPAPIPLGAASDSYADGEPPVVESASSDSVEAVVEAFHQAIAEWDVDAICAQLSSRAQVHLTGRLVAGDCPGVIRDVMSVDWGGRVQERHAGAETVELWSGDDDIADDETILGTEFNEDGTYAVVRPIAGPYHYIVYDFVKDDGGIKIDVYYPFRRI